MGRRGPRNHFAQKKRDKKNGVVGIVAYKKKPETTFFVLSKFGTFSKFKATLQRLFYLLNFWKQKKQGNEKNRGSGKKNQSKRP